MSSPRCGSCETTGSCGSARLSPRLGCGVARTLFAAGLQVCGEIAAELPIVLDAQAPLEGWYGSFSFVRDSEDFLEGRIPHVTMRRTPGAASTPDI